MTAKIVKFKVEKLEQTPSGLYACGFCGLESNSPAYIMEEPAE